MEELKIALKRAHATWDYDEEADVLYVSVGDAQEGIGLDVGDGLILRYKQDSRELVGLTILGVKTRVAQLFND